KGHTCIPIEELNNIIKDLKYKNNIDLDLDLNLEDFFNSEFFKNKNTPIIIENNKIYMKKIKKYEETIRNYIYSKKHSKNIVELPKSFDKVFGNSQEIDWQKIAGICVFRNKFTAITGGPGTGKTTTVAKIICALLIDNENLKIKLCAPTGKAAVRITESIQNSVKFLKENNIKQEILDKIPTEATTIHRLLGSKKFTTEFKHNENNPIQADIIFVDEASMIDLGMMAKLIKGLDKHTQLVLIGDMDQLASVEAGSVFGDICRRGADNYTKDFIKEFIKENTDKLNNKKSDLKDSIVILKKVYRFDAKSGIGKLAITVNNMNIKESLQLLSKCNNNIEYFEKLQLEEIINKVINGYSDYIKLIENKEENPEKIYNAFNRFRTLCNIKKGRFGTESINEQICQKFRKNPAKKHFYGMPIMIGKNYHNFEIYNGDTGIITYLDENEDKPLFTITNNKGVKTVSLGLIDQWEAAFAITIHKSQGSEFENVLTVLSGKTDFSTKELLYTAITRAKDKFSLYSEKEILKNTITRKITRYSGL
ncbi:MAG: exodeoxyribonuclease V subunit alpha, partial [Candidatus Muirbacterium halophilum]|nr:exodeoxyribonuclease V subunit alpha [Candidatus Muirbacterium halophilum]